MSKTAYEICTEAAKELRPDNPEVDLTFSETQDGYWMIVYATNRRQNEEYQILLGGGTQDETYLRKRVSDCVRQFIRKHGFD